MNKIIGHSNSEMSTPVNMHLNPTPTTVSGKLKSQFK